MIGYTKLFSSILDSSVWSLSKEAKILWITMLAKKDRDQVVRAAIPGLAHAARLTVVETEKALEELEVPDPYSQTKDHEGRRVIRMEEGWFIVNGAKYRDLLGIEERREYKRAKQVEYRRRKKDMKTEGAKAGAKQALADGFEHYNSQATDEADGVK